MTEQEQIDALKSQVNCLRDALTRLTLAYGDAEYNSSFLVLSSTAEQCLAEVKAQAIEDVIDAVTKQGSGMQINVTPYFYDYRVLKFINELKEHAKQLREQAK